MFTGIIEATGIVDALETRNVDVGARLVVKTELDVGALPLGASIAVDGVCLTVIDRARGSFAADLGPETLARTTLGALRPGARVHLERPLRLGDALGGHLVSGHVDGVGEVVSRREIGTALELQIRAPENIVATLVEKGSVTVAGASLTINAVAGNTFSVTLIPHTLAVTTLGALAVGARVNLEGDLIAKHVDRLVHHYIARKQPSVG
ncbi:MAG TPA: riboflavin synthase [Polyangia bacterium]|jgi:riboflavin synthase|nr:riboflavin synthase [Polyangia bacterium]